VLKELVFRDREDKKYVLLWAENKTTNDDKTTFTEENSSPLVYGGIDSDARCG
jgi:hypothetical protein